MIDGITCFYADLHTIECRVPLHILCLFPVQMKTLLPSNVTNNFFFINTETLSHMGDMNEIAIANAYATCHNVQDLLHLRGFTSKPAYTKNKRGKSKKRKKDKG